MGGTVPVGVVEVVLLLAGAEVVGFWKSFEVVFWWLGARAVEGAISPVEAVEEGPYPQSPQGYFELSSFYHK